MLVTCLLSKIMPTNLSASKAACYTSFITSSAFHNIIVNDNIQDDRSTCFPCTGNQIGEDGRTARGWAYGHVNTKFSLMDR